jgi:glucan phosphoethanolaminetransferase (alkaline phosphatase superfamily)
MREATFGEISAADRPSTSHPGKWRAAASLVAVLPALGAAWAAFSIFNAFGEMARDGVGGVGPVATLLYQANPPLIAAALLAAVIAGSLAFTAARHPDRAAALPGLPFFLISVLACAPALLLWTTESFPLDFLAGRVTGTMMETMQHLQNLLFSTAAAAVVVIICALVAWARSRGSRQVSRAMIWGGAALLWLGLAVAFGMRTAYLVEAAARGSL